MGHSVADVRVEPIPSLMTVHTEDVLFSWDPVWRLAQISGGVNGRLFGFAKVQDDGQQVTQHFVARLSSHFMAQVDRGDRAAFPLKEALFSAARTGVHCIIGEDGHSDLCLCILRNRQTAVFNFERVNDHNRTHREKLRDN
jgi:hypothetical protein